MLQENNDITASALVLSSLSSQGSPIPSSPSPSSPSSFSHEYDTSNCFSRLPNETIFTILAFSITTQTPTTATPTGFSQHKQLTVLSQVCRLFNKIASDVLLWQIAFEARFDSGAIIRAGIIDYNVIDGSFGSFGVAEGEGKGEGHIISTTQIQNSSSSEQIQTGGNIWKELYKERQIALNKIKNYIKPTLPSPFVYNNNNNENDDTSITDYLDDFMVESNDNENDITNNDDSSTLESTDQVDDNVDYLYDVDFNFVGNENNEAQTEEIERNILDFDFEDNEEFRFQELSGALEDNVTYTIGDTVKGDAVKENTLKEDIPKENILKEDVSKENILKEDVSKENILKKDVSKDVLKENIVKKEPSRQDIMELNLEDNLEYDETNNTSATNADGNVQDFSFVSEGFDPELDSIFASDTIEIDNFVGTENEETDIQNDEVLVRDTYNSAKEVDHVVQAQNLSGLESNSDLDERYYDESHKLSDYEEKTSKLPNHEELQNFDQDKPQLQDDVESSTKLQNFDRDEPKLQEDPSTKSSDKDSLLKEELPDYDENEEVFQFYDYDESVIRTNLQDHNENEELSQIENSSKEIIVNEQENDLPAYDENEEITNLLNFDYEIKTSQDVMIENNNNSNVPDYIEDERENVFNDSVVDEKVEQENKLPIINEKESNNEENARENNLSNGNVIIENEVINDNEDSHSNYDENEIYEYNLENDVDIVEEMTDDDEIYQGFNNPLIFAVNNQVLELDWIIYANIQSRRKRRKIIRQNDDPELLKTLNIIWKICQENDGMNSEVLLGSDVKELVVSLIQSLDKMETQTECLSVALQILSILVSWHPELTIDLHKNNLFWTTIHYVMIYIDIFFPELDNNFVFKQKQLVLPASAGSAIHIFFHTSFFNLSNPNEFIDNYIPPPQLIPDSNIFNNVYNNSELKPGEGIIQPFEDLSGKWCGYNASLLRPLRESAMDITSLEFSPSEPGKVYYLNRIDNNDTVRVTDKVVKEFSGTGTDQTGEFVIKHGMITEKGNVNFIKAYIGKQSWIYDGVLLPVGICGRWGTPFEWKGIFWIWQRL